jgi:Na+/H+ antiporter NhaD/arsenite permease-like protein
VISALAIIFVVAYAAIALEHPIGINKSATALVGAGLLWTVYAVLGGGGQIAVEDQLNESVASTAQIIFFLMGAMTIVEVIAAHNGFEIITSRIRTDKLSSLLLLIGVVTFFLSSVLDNLTTTIVMIALVRKVLDARADRLLFASMIVIAANAGGAFSPIGDVTTTMLWIGGQVSPLGIIKSTFIASLVNLLVPLIWLAFEVRGRRFQSVSAQGDPESAGTTVFERHLMFWMGLGILILVPAFKTATHLPPFLGILFGLGLLWLVGEIVHRDKEPEHRHPLTLVAALTRIDMSSIVFFVGILLAVAALEHAQLLSALAAWLDHAIGRKDLIVLILGLLSAIIDNVPLVAATMGMYSLTQFPPDSFQWEFIAYCAGTGGSILIIGSAAGVAAMGLEQIHFIWYMRKIGGLALAGYLAGAIAYIVQYQLMH